METPQQTDITLAVCCVASGAAVWWWMTRRSLEIHQTTQQELDNTKKMNVFLAKKAKRIGIFKERLQSCRPTLSVPALPNLVDQSKSPYSQAFCSPKQIATHERISTTVLDRENSLPTRGHAKDFMDVPTSFPHETAASAEAKENINDEICRALKSIVMNRELDLLDLLSVQDDQERDDQEREDCLDYNDELSSRLRNNPNEILLTLDTPLFGTTKSLLRAFPDLSSSGGLCSQIVVPQADVLHYFQSIQSVIEERSMNFRVNVICQRLDHWLCASSQLGITTLLSYFDFECTFQGNSATRMSPALDIMRYFRFGYPSRSRSLLVLTIKLRTPFACLADIHDFVIVEGARCGYKVNVVRVWASSLTTVMYEVCGGTCIAKVIHVCKKV